MKIFIFKVEVLYGTPPSDITSLTRSVVQKYLIDISVTYLEKYQTILNQIIGLCNQCFSIKYNDTLYT